jgi:crotonobetainyl-CoA:carnitine CoA-transferase CaiB-like acyl-CoA transferase
MSATARSALSGITVLDFTRVLAGPYCTRLLADLGARVIKIERPGEGDEVRYAPYQLDPARVDQSTYYVRLNAGKRGIAIDLAHPAARELVYDLVRQSDVVVENFTPGVMTRYGMDEPALRRVRADLVYCAISGFGQTGPLRSTQAYAHLINAISGLMELDRGNDPAPRVAYLQAADVLAGAHAFGAVCAALFERTRSGAGAYLDVSMLECLLAADDITYNAHVNGGPVYRGPRPGMLVERVGDSYLAMQTIGAPHLFRRLLDLLGQPELATDPRFATPVARRENWAAFRQIVCDWLARFNDRAAALAALAEARIPSVPMLQPEEVTTHPHLAARDSFPAVTHRTHGEVKVIAAPFHWNGSAIAPAGPAPYLPGEHSGAVLRELLGYGEERIEALLRDKVVAGDA